MDLRSELPRGRNDHGDGTFHRAERSLVLDVSEHGQEERDSLARSRLGDSDDVASRHDGGDGLGLNRRWSLVSQSFDDLDTADE